MKTMKNLKAALLFSFVSFAPLFAQNRTTTTDTFTSIPVQSPTLIASLGGSASQPGQTTAYYAVVANFIGGSVTSNIVTVTNTPNTLSSTNLVALQWTPVAGVVTYDVLKLTSAAFPTGSTSISLATALTTNTSTDTGGSTSSYTILSPPANVQVVLDLNSRDYVTPQLEIAQVGSVKAGLAINTSVVNLFSVVVNATATGVTVPAAQIVNGLFTHSPTGAVNDTTDTATAIVAALPSCTATTTTGSGFTFQVFNTSSGSNVITVVGGTGVTIVGTATVAQNAVRNFRGIVTACSGTPTVKLYSTGSGAF